MAQSSTYGLEDSYALRRSTDMAYRSWFSYNSSQSAIFKTELHTASMCCLICWSAMIWIGRFWDVLSLPHLV